MRLIIDYPVTCHVTVTCNLSQLSLAATQSLQANGYSMVTCDKRMAKPEEIT